jgi:glycine/D-amino acid oxidase-like deaminating enzyme
MDAITTLGGMLVVTETEAEVIVIGGGIVGCAAAYELAKRGTWVILVEKGAIASEQSSRAWGFVRQQGRDPAELPLMLAANRIWQGLGEELRADIEWVQGGNLGLAANDERMEQHRDWLPLAKEFGLDTRLLSRQRVQQLIPSLEGPFVGGMFTPSDGHAEPRKATLAFAHAAQEHGAIIKCGCAAEGVERTAGRISGVRTEKGLLRAPILVCAAGAWSARVARMVGLALPQRVVCSTAAQTGPVPPITPSGVWAPGIAFRQRTDGTLYIAGGGRSDYYLTLESFQHLRLFLPNYLKNWRMFRLHVGADLLRDSARRAPWSPARQHPFAHTVGVEPSPNPASVDESRQNLEALAPSLKGIRITRVWAGLIDATPDAIPVLGPVAHPRGFIFATGFSGHGFAMGPIAGRLIAEGILDGRPSLDLHALRYARFQEGDVGKPRNVL